MKKRKRISPNYMDCVPIRCENRPWEKDANGMAVIDVENKGFYAFLAQKIWKKPRFSHISLDKYGTVVWENIDGTHTVYEIIGQMKAAFPEEEDRMLDRVVTFMATLQKCRFIRMKRP